MSKKVAVADPFQPKITRNDRFAQMSHQEKVIEQKKKEIQAKLEARQKTVSVESAKSASPTLKQTTSKSAPSTNSKKTELKNKNMFNLFSNDGSFLDTFKQFKDKKMDSKLKSYKAKESYNSERANNKSSRWSQRRRSPSPKNVSPLKNRISRFSCDKNFEPKITINTSFNMSPQNVTGQPLLKNLIFQSPVPITTAPVIAAPPLLLNVPPPQIPQLGNVLVSGQSVNVTIPVSSVLTTTVTLPPPTAVTNVIMPVPPPTVELSSIPPPNPIQIQNIPQPEPINTLNIPHPAPIQVQNIPTPSQIQLNEIPNPKPLDLLQIPPPPTDDKSNNISDRDFIKNIPPPNKSVPPPSTSVNMNSLLPVPVSIPPPQSSLTVQSITAACQNILVHAIPPPQTINLPPPNLQITVTSSIPSLMAQPILPPPGMGVNVSCPPPMLAPPPPSFVNQPPPMTSQMPPMNVPPPQTVVTVQPMPVGGPFRDSNSVFPPGTPDYEAMASLGRMVAQCGQGIEDVVRQRKTQDPNLWFLFHKESAAYRQYQQLLERFKNEIKNEDSSDVKDSNRYKPEDIYEPEMATEDDYEGACVINPESSVKRETSDSESGNAKRKRRSRWGDKDESLPPPAVIANSPVILPHQAGTSVMLSKVTRTDPGLLQYAQTTFSSINLTDEEWKKAEDHYKINLLYQDMVKKREELEKLQQAGRNKYDYDSDEDIDGGTWEHKLRDKEMMATQLWAQELTRQAEGKHHIGDFLPPEEMKRFMEKTNASKEGLTLSFSDYKEFKIKEDNIGFKMLQKLGWSQGQGLGSNGCGIVEPINKAASRDQNQGLGLGDSGDEKEDEYEAYRKRMMLAYRFRPNPLNNPRRPYY